MTQALYPHQRAAIAQIEQGLPIYVAHDPGLGKSRVALEAAKRRKVQRLLIIAPASGKYVWANEVWKWWPEMPLTIINGPADIGRMNGRGITLITYGLLSLRDSIFVSAIAKGLKFDMTVADEAAALKNSTANRTKAILTKMLPKLGFLVPMSGTPAPNHAGELFPILRACFPEALSRGINGAPPLSEWDFQEMFCRVTSKRFGGGRDIRVIEGSKNLPELRRRIGPFMKRVKKQDVLTSLPAIRWDVVPVQAKAEFAPLPDKLKLMSDDDLLKYLAGAGNDEHIMRLRRLLGLAKVDAAVEFLQDFLDNLPEDQKILVFAHHREVIEKLVDGLGGSSPVVITGASSTSERAAAVDAFLTRPQCRLLVGNIAAAGTGLTLVSSTCRCSNVFFVEASYSVGDNHQAACRIHRIGQHDAVVARFLTASGTIDDRIMEILARKATDFSQLFD